MRGEVVGAAPALHAAPVEEPVDEVLEARALFFEGLDGGEEGMDVL